jgi:sugar transferase (PEP-CTERM/EpsH1 system associated)
VLFLTTRFPVPTRRGDQVRAIHQLRLLARRHALTLCALVPTVPPPAALEEVAALGVRVEIVPLGWAGAIPALGRVLLGDPRPLQVLLYARRAARAHVERLIAGGGFDVVHAQLVRAATYLPQAGGPPVVVDLIDALSANFARRARHERGPLALVSRCEARRLARFETALLGRVHAGLVVSEAERAELHGDNVRVVPNGVDVDAFRYRENGRPPARVLFAGNLGYFPNVDAVRWLVGDIFPRVRTARPDAELRLVGARPARAVQTLARAAGVSLAADVSAMPPELGAATVAVIPMRAGSGLQNKVLEAMAVGTPVVTTPRAIAALAVRPGEDVLVAEDAAGIAAAVVDLLRDPERARAMARAARAVVERRYRWEDCAAGVEAAWESAVRGPS